MDQSSRSLLDMLHNLSEDKKSSRKDELLALFGPQKPSSSEPIVQEPERPTETNRKGNASELLAALMNSSTPKKEDTDISASFLSSLMSKSGSPYTPKEPAAVIPENPQPSYLNPRHEYLSAQGTDRTMSPQNGSAVIQPFFSHTDPFEELEKAHRPQAAGTLNSTADVQAAPAKRDIVSSDPVAQTRPVVISTPPKTTSPALLASNDHHRENLGKGSAEPRANTKPSPVIEATVQATRTTQHTATAQATTPTASALAISLPLEHSSTLKLAGSKLSALAITQSMPVTKIALKTDPLNKNIIAASRKYIVYPLIKENSSGLIRIVDQDTGETSILSQHSSKVISVTLAKAFDENGKNALLSIDTDSNIILWSIESTSKVEKVFEIVGPSDTSHKARAVWNMDGKYFGVSITSRLYIFDYRSISSNPALVKVKLHPEMKHVLCICKADKAIRDFTFSHDSTSLAGIDKAGHVNLWPLESTGKTVIAAASILLGEKNLLSINFVGERHVVVGVQTNEAFLLVDIKAAKAAQELQLFGQKDNYGSRYKLCYIQESQLLVISNLAKGRLYVIDLNATSAVESQTNSIIANLSLQSSHLEALGNYKTVCELTFPSEETGEWLDSTCLATDSGFDLFLAHSKGYTLIPVAKDLLSQLFSQAQLLDRSLITKMQVIGRLNVGEDTAPAVLEESIKVVKPEVEKPATNAPRSAKKSHKVSELSSGGQLVVEPRNAEIAARVEANLKATLAAEFQKNNALLKAQIEKLQEGNDARHETVLRLVSETLSKNTTQVLQSAVRDVMTQTILPTIKSAVDASIASHMQTHLTSALNEVMAKEMGAAVHTAVNNSIESAGIVSQLQIATSTMNDDLSTRHKHMEQNLAGALVRLDAQILERQKSDSEKLDQLVQNLKSIELQVAKLAHAQEGHASRPGPPPPPTVPMLPPPSSLASSQSPVYQTPVNQSASAPQPPEDYSKYHSLIVEFIGNTRKVIAGDYDGVPFLKQFLAWQPDAHVKDGICRSLATDQLQLLAFLHALAAELSEADAYNRVHWMDSALKFLAVKRDSRLLTIGPQLLAGIRSNLLQSLERAPPGSQYSHLVELVAGRVAA